MRVIIFMALMWFCAFRASWLLPSSAYELENPLVRYRALRGSLYALNVIVMLALMWLGVP